MSRATLVALAAVVVWIFWCFVVVLSLVPMIRRHITMWPWFMAYLLCLLPVLVLAITFSVRAGRAAAE
jgi:hypothetical protein